MLEEFKLISLKQKKTKKHNIKTLQEKVFVNDSGKGIVLAGSEFGLLQVAESQPYTELPKCTLRPDFVLIAPALKTVGRIEVPLSKIDLFS